MRDIHVSIVTLSTKLKNVFPSVPSATQQPACHVVVHVNTSMSAMWKHKTTSPRFKKRDFRWNTMKILLLRNIDTFSVASTRQTSRVLYLPCFAVIVLLFTAPVAECKGVKLSINWTWLPKPTLCKTSTSRSESQAKPQFLVILEAATEVLSRKEKVDKLFKDKDSAIKC